MEKSGFPESQIMGRSFCSTELPPTEELQTSKEILPEKIADRAGDNKKFFAVFGMVKSFIKNKAQYMPPLYSG